MKYIIPSISILLIVIISNCTNNPEKKNNDKFSDSRTTINLQITETQEPFVLKKFKPSEISPYFLNGKWGYINNEGEIVIKPVFDACGFFVENYAWVKTKGKYKIINSKGEFIQDSASYDDAGKTFKGMIPVKKGNLWGVIDTTGNLLIPFAYEQISFPKDEAIIHIKQNKQWGFINFSGQQICAPIYNYDFNFNGNCAIVSRGYRKYGVINKQGKEVVKCNYSKVTIINDSTFILQKQPDYKTNKYGVISNDKLLYPIEYDRINHLFDTLLVLTKENKSGIVNFKGDTILDFVYSDLKVGNTNFIAAKKGDKWGFINLLNDTIIDFQFDEAEAFHNKVAIVGKGYKKYIANSSSCPSGLINYKGELVIPISDQTLKFLSDNLIMAISDFNKYTIYTTEGVQINSTFFDEKQYHNAEDHTGAIEDPMNFYQFVNGFAIVGQNGRVGMINTKGEIVIPLKYHHLEPMNEYGYTKARYLNKYGIVDYTGKEIVPTGFDNIGYDYNSDHYYLQLEIKKGESKYGRDYVNVGYFNYNGKYLGNSIIGKPTPFVLEDNISKIRNSYNRIQKETKNNKKTECEFLEKGLVGQYTNNKFVVTDNNNGIRYEYYYDESLNRNGPFFIYKVQGKIENRYYFLHGRIIRWLDENKKEQLIADALFAPENEQHYLARKYKSEFENAELIKKHNTNRTKTIVDNLCTKIREDIRNDRYKKGDSDNQSMGEYVSRTETYLDNKKNQIYSSNSVSDEGGGYTEESFYSDGKLLYSYSDRNYIDNTKEIDEPYWTSGQYTVIEYYNNGELVFTEKMKDGITEIIINH